MIDIGANLTAKAFLSDLGAVLERAATAGVTRMIVTGASETESPAAAALASAHPGRLFATAGVHPHHAKDCGETTIPALRNLAQNGAVAVGECGLDYNRDFSPRDVQREWFERQVELAVELGMPMFLHEREASEDLLKILEPHLPKLPRVVVHCFTGEREALQAYLGHDFFIGITGWICDERRGKHLHDLVGLIPQGRLMIETDSPYLLPRTIQPKPKSRRNEPAYLTYVRDMVASCRGETPEDLAATTTRTAEQFFALPPQEALA